MSSWGIRMELLRIAMRAPCHQGEGSLHLAHADGPPCDVPPSSDISHPVPDADGRGGRFNFPGQTYLDPLIVLTRRVLQPSCIVPRFSPEASRYLRPTF